MTAQTLWVEVTKGVSSPRTPAVLAGVRAQFAYLVTPRPVAERQALRWGWNLSALLDEAIGRYRLSVDTLHAWQPLSPGADGGLNQRAVALRCVADPAEGRLALALVGGVSAANAAQARSLAGDFAHALHASFPEDYKLTPAASQEEFTRAAGWDLLNAAVKPGAIAEISRAEAALRGAHEPAYLLGRWQPSKFANEQIWRALAESATPLLFSALLQPTLPVEAELQKLAELAEAAQKAAAEAPSLFARDEAAQAAQGHRARLESLQRLYLIQVHLAAAGEIPGYACQLIGSALTHNEETGAARTRASWQAAVDSARLGLWKQGLLDLQPAAAFPNQPAPLARLRLLGSFAEACAVLRYPYPNEGNLVGIRLS
ncbi:MAG: hypothetical protein L0Z70_14410 [Chloroflexi bacterium]|nr:hypothetical protein [Chloroflexota bacterium]